MGCRWMYVQGMKNSVLVAFTTTGASRLYIFGPPQLTSYFSALDMTGLPIQGGMSFEERDGGVHHYFEASGRNLIL